MCIGGSPSTPTAPALPPAPPPPPTAANAQVTDARRRERRRGSIAGRGATISTSAQGDLSSANTERKSLLGA